MSDPKGFLKFQREEIPRRPIAERLNDWAEVDTTPPASMLEKQSRRCMDCGVPFCQSDSGCPLHNLIPEWNSLISQNRWQDAAARLHATNNFPEFTGRLCPAPCESACVLGVNGDPVNIKSAEWGIIDRAFASGWVQPQKSPHQTGKRIAIVGSGPAGLAAAQQLARKGHGVTLFEKAKLMGGLLRYGIPDFKMQKDLIDRRLVQLQAEGVEFRSQVEFGKDLTFEQIQKNFDALVLATGADLPRDLTVPGRNLQGIHLAIDYLTEQNQLLSGQISQLTMSAHGKKVLILGGGDTGSDCLGTALRQGATQVLQFEIQTKPPKDRAAHTPWPLWPMKLKSSHAHEEGGLRQWSLATQEFVGEQGRVRQVRTACLETQAEHTFDVDMVILAMGFMGPNRGLERALPGLTFSARGSIVTDEQMMTSVAGVFAAGDNRRGASLIVWAIAEGRRLADSVHDYLSVKN